MAAKNAPKKAQWNAVRVACPDGNTWLVGVPAIEDDYADMLMQLDSLSKGHATERARDMDRKDLEHWFLEQFTLDDVREAGHRIARPTYDQLIGSYLRTSDTYECQIEFITV